MALITFDVTGAAVSSRLAHGKAEWHVAFHLALPFDEHMTLATGEDVRTIRLALTVKAMTPDMDRWLQERRDEPNEAVIGRMHYFEDPPAVLADANIPPDAFDHIMRLVEQGRIPRSLTVEVQNLNHDWRPDGSGKVWDNRTKAIVGLTNVNLDVPISELKPEGEPDHGSQLAKLSREALTLQRWMLAALIVAAVTLWFGR